MEYKTWNTLDTMEYKLAQTVYGFIGQKRNIFFLDYATVTYTLVTDNMLGT